MKDQYRTISFPLSNKDPRSVLETYAAEFATTGGSDVEKAVWMFAHALRDYLEGKIGEWEFGSLCFALQTDSNLASAISRSSQLQRFVSEGVDIQWLSQSSQFANYKSELRNFLNSLARSV